MAHSKSEYAAAANAAELVIAEIGGHAMGRFYVRVPGEAFDADQVTLPCSSCGLSEYACECDPFFDDGDSAAEHRVAESLRQIDWCRQGRGKPDGFTREEY